jgi:predicted lipoprotein with Yx(FWY)xxD motif
MTRRSITFLAGATGLLLGAFAVAGCGSGGGSNARSPAPPKTANGQSATVGVANENVGKILVDSQGHPLYLFSADQKPGDTNGQGVNAFGGHWYVLSSSGDEITTPAGSGGSGY